MLLQFSFVLFYNAFADKFCTLNFAFVNDDLVVLSQLNFIILDGFVEGFVFGSTFFDIMDDLE